VLLTQPKVFKDPTGKFFIVLANVENVFSKLLVAKEFRYFDYENNSCRALAHSEKLKGGNESSIEKQKVLVRNLARNVTSKMLEDRFAKYGTIISARVVIDERRNSLGYGFVVFEDDKSATKARIGEFGSKRIPEALENPKGPDDSEPADLFYNDFDSI
jgi:RNA recognition motif-containing protein